MIMGHIGSHDRGALRALYEWWEIGFFTLNSNDIRGMVLAIKYDMSKQCAYAWDGVGDFSYESYIRDFCEFDRSL